MTRSRESGLAPVPWGEVVTRVLSTQAAALRRLARGPCDVRGHRDSERGRHSRDAIAGDFEVSFRQIHAARVPTEAPPE